MHVQQALKAGWFTVVHSPCTFVRYELPTLKGWVDVELRKNLSKENVEKLFSLAWKYDLELLLRSCFEKLSLDELENSQEWKEAFGGKRKYIVELMKRL